ncbi:MAG: nucleoside recognition domain-containing protein [bacterium]
MAEQQPNNVMDAFVIGARRGLHVALNGIAPNVLMAFVIIAVLNMTGILDLIGKVFGPVMAIFGLPGEAMAGLVAAWLSLGGGVGAIAGLYSNGLLTETHVTILMPAVCMLGAQLQYMGRIAITADMDTRQIPLTMLLNVVVALAFMFVWRFFV